MKHTLDDLRAHAVAQTLFRPTTLAGAMTQLSFVQADPIRAPARAQDLILRHRAKGYRADDLERYYPSLDIEEGYLYAYGFLPRSLWQLRHPPDRARLSVLEKRLLEAVHRLGAAHPGDLQAEFGGRAVNAWGGYSSVAQLALERLHRRGLLRVARREKGIRVYEPCPPPAELPSPQQIFRELVVTVVKILAPISERSLRTVLAPLGRSLCSVSDQRAAITELLREGQLGEASVDGHRYIWTARDVARRASPKTAEPVPLVRLLAPFDPLVWDRRRFEHLWGWVYRFEAYTPIAKRVRGYYAMPVSWRHQIIGWANVQRPEGGLDVELGFVDKRPREREFEVQLEAELDRLRAFLRPRRQRRG